MDKQDEAPIPRIALDGPSALVFYRDLSSQATSPADKKTNWKTASSAPVPDNAYLSDDDVAATLLEENVFGRLAPSDELSPSDDCGPSELEMVRCDMQSLGYCASASRDLKRIPYESLGVLPPSEHFPLFILTGSTQSRRVVKNVRQRTCTLAFPRRSFFRVNDIVYVPCPELLFVLMSRYLSLSGLMLLGMELCGHYRLVGSSPRRPLEGVETLYDQRPLTTVDRLTRFVTLMDNSSGIKDARRALKYIADGAASPMESILYLLLCLPRSLGGYGISTPVLNAKRPVTKSAGSLTFSKHLIPDLYWPQQRLDVEYDSEEFHSSPDRLAAGARRTLALRAMHVEVVSITYDIISDSTAFNTTARMIVRRLGMRNYKASPTVEKRRTALRSSLLHSKDIYTHLPG